MKKNKIYASYETIVPLVETNNEKVLEASNLKILWVASVGEAHFLAETLNKPWTINIIKKSLGGKRLVI